MHGACDALNGHQIAGLDYAAQHQAEAADDVGDCILQTQRDRHTSNTKGGDKCGRIDAEYGLQYHRCAGDPDGHAREVHENRGAGNLRIVQNLAQHAADDAVGHKYDGQYNGQPDEFAGVHLKPACDVFCIFSHTPTVSVVSGEVVETGWQKAESAYGRFRYSWRSHQVLLGLRVKEVDQLGAEGKVDLRAVGDAGPVLGGQVGAFAGRLAHGTAGMYGFGGDVGRVLVADVVVERGGNRR